MSLPSRPERVCTCGWYEGQHRHCEIHGVRRAHSRSEYRRLTALGVRVEPPEEPALKSSDRPHRCALCGAFYPRFQTDDPHEKIVCKRCGTEWVKG